MRPKDERKVRAITAAVLTLCQEGGVTHLTTAGIAHHAGVSPRTLYLNYENKTALLSAVFTLAQTRLRAGWKRPAGDGAAQLAALMRFNVARARRLPREADYVFAMTANPELLDAQARAAARQPDPAFVAVYVLLDTTLPQAVVQALVAVPMTLWRQDHDVADVAINSAIAAVVQALRG